MTSNRRWNAGGAGRCNPVHISFSNSRREKFVTRRTERDADGLLAGFPASPQFKLNLRLRNEHFETTDCIASGFARLA